MRAFVAVDLAEPPELVRIGGRAPRHLHVTLRFLGDLPEARFSDLVDACEAAATAEPPFDLELHGLGAFPSGRAPRVLWIGLSAGAEALARLAGRIDDRLAAAGVPREPRPFRPHATIARVRGPRDARRALDLLERGASVSFGVQRVREIRVYESRGAPEATEHLVRAVVPLRGPAAPG